ncbi:MAG: tRNA (adenosine(37)-N6)-threonylcarbamoyltransferase complex transferase subunit TsaD [Holosporales bacterium]|jgi:N6-L-threonylcarbamoyladenine synthase|nr:tRNA (adenosine(37)-N6)-threonylcarbamoyltransferase complex transferase subunit TsaD [Holosporales bacterium]
MKVLAIESSCDETSAAVVCDDPKPESRILSNVIKSQIDLHTKYGGVVPEFAARSHLDAIDIVITEALNIAGVTMDDIDVIAATAGPGLIGGLIVGTVTAKAIALVKNNPFVAVNHLEGHLLTTRLCYDVEFPYLLLLASGGHFFFAEVLGVGRYNILGETLDDAAGEAFDKVGKMLGFGYPGGIAIEEAARSGNGNRFKYTVPLQKRHGCNTSFSGLKTATKNHIGSLEMLTAQDKADIAASFQDIVVRFIVKQLGTAYEMTSLKPRNVVASGGVAANIALRAGISEFSQKMNLAFFAPPTSLCSDNAAMIGWCAIERIRVGYGYSDLSAKTFPCGLP